MNHPSTPHHTRHSRSVARFLCCLLAAAMMMTATGCSGGKPAAVQAERDILVTVAQPETGSLELTTDFVGNVVPAEQVSVFSKVAGTVLTTHVSVGDQVRKGDLLFEIDPSDVQLQVNIAEAALNAAQASVDQALGSTMDSQLLQAESGLKQAENAFKTADDALDDYEDTTSAARRKLRTAIDGYKANLDAINAKITTLPTEVQTAKDAYINAEIAWKQAAPDKQDELLEEYKTAYATYLAIDKEYQEALKTIPTLETAIASAQAQIDAMDDKEDTTKKQLEMAAKNAALAKDTAEKSYDLVSDRVKTDASTTAQAQLNQARASYEAAARQLEYTKVYSPIDGVIESKGVTEQGMVVQTSPAYVVSNKSQMQVTFYVSADAVRSMSAGDAVTIESGSRTYQGSISEVGVMVDSASGLFKVKANVEGDTSGLLSGLTVKVKAVTAKADQSLLIPQSCVYYEDGNPYVYTYSDGTAHKTPISVGISNVEQVEVLDGLTSNMELITSWHPNLMDGVKVTLSGDGAAQPVNASTDEEADDSSDPETASPETEE